ncbi:MAG TPA: tripartite tricarboxylate transporter substrate binding protein [Quisquiliibacterium sp.]|nr:tripartite tricarboxylate transporter substrate binding protein [Quisquiliibacterium sp.]
MKTSSGRRRFIWQAGGGGLALGLGVQARAQQDWPQSPIKVIVPFPAGGSTDMLTRLIGRGVSARVGQPVLVDNRGGAGGMIGTGAIAKSPPDGYHFGMTTVSSIVTAPFLYEKVPYDVDREITFVTLLCTVPMVLAVHPSVPVDTAPELMQHLRRNRGKLSYGTVAVGHYGHVASEHINVTNDAAMVHVPYKGEAQMLQDLLANQLPLSFVTIATAKPHVEAGKLKLVAITGTKRHQAMPNVPTFAEQGLDADVFKMNPGWIGMIAPAKTPPAVVQRMSSEVVAAAREPEVSERIAAMGMNLVGSTPEAYTEAYRAEKVSWQKLLTQAGVRPQ